MVPQQLLYEFVFYLAYCFLVGDVKNKLCHALIDTALYSLKKKVLEDIISNYIKEQSVKKISLSGKNKPDFVHIILKNNIEVDCRKYLPNITINISCNQFSSYYDIEKQFREMEHTAPCRIQI